MANTESAREHIEKQIENIDSPVGQVGAICLAWLEYAPETAAPLLMAKENKTLQTSLEIEKRNSKDSQDDAVEAQRKLCEERDKYEEQIKALKEAQQGTENEELKRLQVETAARAGHIKALEKELEDLKNAQQAAPPAPPEKTPEEKAFARHFENAKGEFNAMIDTVDEMPEDLRAKYKAAMKQLMEVMTALVKEA